MQHIIKKQVIELEIDKRLDAFDIQHQVSDWFWNRFLSQLNDELTKLSATNEVLYIDRLEIDLGVINITQLQATQLHKIVLPAIAEKIQESISASHHTNSMVNSRSGAVHHFTQWLQYMQKGYLPWNVLQVTDEWRQQVLEALATDHHSVTLLLKELQKNKTVAAIIAHQHTTTWLAQLITVLTAENQSKLPGAITAIEKLLTQLHEQQPGITQEAVPSNKMIWQQVLHLVAASKQKITTPQLAATIIEKNITLVQLPVLEKIIQSPADHSPIHDAIILVQQKFIPATPASTKQTGNTKDTDHRNSDAVQQQPNKQPAVDASQATTGNETKPNNTDAGHQQPETLQQVADAGPQPADTRPPATELNSQVVAAEGGLFVQHAGLTLVHPFLRSLFSLCGLLNEKQFASAACQQKAIYLLHYIATGRVSAEEHELVIPKVLCNYPIEEPVNTDTVLTINELQEADDMMRAAIAQWSILKSTSPDGLRQGFLQRSGKLQTKNEQLYIEIEKNTIDVLLDHLPWNLSLIRLPWTGQIIRVEWR
jgi:contractile injection system tape measure protein